jgi:hypothetical protein
MTSLHKHHRLMRSQGGDDSWGNQIEIPSDLHELVHAHPEQGYEYGLLVKSHDDPADIRPDLAGFMQALGLEGTVDPAKAPRKRFEKGSEERRKRRTISIRVPNDTENGGEIWDETIEQMKSRLVLMDLYEHVNDVPTYEGLIASLRDWLNNG